MVVVAVIGGLLVNLFTLIFKNIYKLLCKLFRKTKRVIEDIRFSIRVKQKKITDADMFKISLKKQKGEATDKEIEAYDYRKVQLFTNLSEEQKQEMAKLKERVEKTLGKYSQK